MTISPAFQTYPWLCNGLTMTLYTAWQASRTEQENRELGKLPYRHCTFSGAGGVPLFGLVAIPPHPRGTIVATYGITGDLENQGFLQLLGRKAIARHYAVVLFDWRGHGKTAELSPTLTSDGLYEGEDFVRIAAGSKEIGCPAPFWFVGFSLGGQLALWAVRAAETWGTELNLAGAEIGGGAAICPNLDANRSLTHLSSHPLGRYLERSIVRQLQQLAWRIYRAHPQALEAAAISRLKSIRDFDRELVIESLGFTTVADYYAASSPLPWLPHLTKPTLILYARDDPLFAPAIVPDLQAACAGNPAVDLLLTDRGGHVGYLSNPACQRRYGDSDWWWAWNRVLDWCERQEKL